MSKLIMLEVLFLLLAADVGSQVCPTTNQSGENGQVELRAAIVESNEIEIGFTFGLLNNLASPIFVATDPVRVNGSAGFYISTGEFETTVVAESRVYEPTYPIPYSSETSVKLKRLEPGECYSGTSILSWPLTETVPPKNLHIQARTIHPKEVEMIRFSFGYFVEDDGLLSFLRRKPTGWYISGNELIDSDSKGQRRRLYEIQHLVSTTVELSQ